MVEKIMTGAVFYYPNIEFNYYTYKCFYMIAVMMSFGVEIT